MIWTIPNILTVLRLLAAPFLALTFVLLPPPYADVVGLGLFVGASLTDYVDGYLARKMNQQSKFGTMLDPIADKAMVVIALMVIGALYGLNLWVLVPGAIILLREVFVSGLREFLGADAGKLAVTKLAKWKTTVQMVAIAVLLARGLFEHYFGMNSFGMDATMVAEILKGNLADEAGLVWNYRAMIASFYGGIALLWLAAILTFVTGWDYFAKSLPYLREEPK
ncbi:CDP-diacylglycerol--glycerol-3-phosphate 3-phosphatidyltransferase [Actibacterium mucosum KCTC 23349]|uniref:CDP-diacylglycerol--glycerol-3-phosphate 3-phosphatidyltransferase n=1 Tax=Actibacterium mucosum KCTC 23349 TaxID=1454373 RepID=A0A037ZC45_9RHOB|nr:CDP-diacylglycerol--glycerol-3-phosphate 3-phosphatidyltransferase [Actibacterium mucosum]KAJ54059.1 CDP-diacylglycerol--glycerol-3-phosphate 3-phosphatidyltransferase [Actibacterium mucosum KCTC 23349]